MALRYVERYATTRSKLIAYMERKLRERGWDGEAAPEPAALADQFVELGYVNDRFFGEARARSLSARGYGGRRVSDTLRAAGIEEGLREEIGGSLDDRAALATFARRKRLGPFGADAEMDFAARQKQFAACLRAGHPVGLVKELFDSETAEAFEDGAA